MKICVAQTRPVKGDIEANIERHKALITLALSHHADMIVFPELSITGYEPELAGELATSISDKRFDIFQHISDEKNITIGIGAPIRNDEGIAIGLVIFQPGKPRELYAKKHLHADEYPFFISGESTIDKIGDEHPIALAICYELSVPEHAAIACNNGASIYLTSVAKTATGVANANDTLVTIAKQYNMITLMSNCLGLNGGDECVGHSAIWNREGILVGQLNDRDEGVLMIDTITGEVTQESITG